MPSIAPRFSELLIHEFLQFHTLGRPASSLLVLKPYFELLHQFALGNLRTLLSTNHLGNKRRNVVLSLAVSVRRRLDNITDFHFALSIENTIHQHARKYTRHFRQLLLQILILGKLIRRIVDWHLGSWINKFRHEINNANTSPRTIIIAINLKQRIRANHQMKLNLKRLRFAIQLSRLQRRITSQILHNTLIQFTRVLGRLLHHRITDTLQLHNLRRCLALSDALLRDQRNRNCTGIFTQRQRH